MDYVDGPPLTADQSVGPASPYVGADTRYVGADTRYVRGDTRYVGIDIGGSGTRAALCAADGTLLAFCLGPPIGHRTGAAARRDISRALSAALAGITPLVRDADASVWAGSAGLSLPGRRELLELELTTRLPAARVQVSSDAHIAVCGGLGAGEGVAVLAGTGSIAMARTADGRLARAGGWGYLLGDEGSGYWLGREALAATLRVLEGRAAEGPLSRSVLGHTAAATPTEIVAWANRSLTPVTHIASLAPLVSQAARADDASAVDMLCRAGHALAETALAAARQLSSRASLRVVCVGGVWAAGDHLRRPFMDRLAGATFEPPALPPVFGAVLLAMGTPSQSVVDRLRDASRTASNGS